MIYTTSKVRIKDHQATVDKTIILYRGDRNVEIQFEILENGYREYRVEGTNVILNLNASYGQLIVQKPDHTHIFSDIVPTQDGKVIFTIPRELIDETTEVGQYTFQIRLYNEDQSSRVTLPPVVGGIDIVEPIAIDDSFVDTAMVGYSIVQTDSDDEEDKRFDENGNYIKTYWEHGDIITAGKLNKVEDSLEVINANDIQNHIDVNDKIDALVESIDAAEYVTETELNAKGYLTEHQDISGKADKTEIPTKTSQLTNDSGFLNQIPAEYVTETELNAKGYLTEHQDISNKVDKVSGKGLSTNDYTTSEKNKLAGIEAGANKVIVYKAKECITFTSDDGTCTPLAVQKAVGLFPPKAHEHSQYLTEHQDISGKADKTEIPTKTSQLTNDSGLATKEYVDNAITNLNINIDIDIDYDSLLAFDTTEIIREPNYVDNDNYIDNDNNLILDDDLPAGTYTLKYEFEDGSYSDITSFIIEDNEDVLESLPEGTTYKLNARWSGSTNTTADYNGAIAYKIPINIGENSSLKLTIANLPSVIESNTVNKIYYIDRDGNLVVGYDTLDQNFREVNPSFVSFLNGGKTMELILTPKTSHEYIAVSFLASSGSGDAITEDDMKNFIISLEEIDRQQILTLPINSTLIHDARFDESSGTMVENGGLVTFHIPVTGDGNTTYDVNIEGLPNPTVKDSANKIYYQNGDGSYIRPELSSIYFKHMTANEITFADDLKSCNLKITPASGVAYIVLTLLISESNGDYISLSGKDMLNTVKVSLNGGVVNVLEEAEIYLNQRYSKTNNAFTAADGLVSLVIPFTNVDNDTMMLSFSNLKYSLLGGNSGLYILDNNKSNGLYVNGNGAFRQMTSGVEVAIDGLSGTVTFVPPINEGYLAITLRINDTNTAVTATDFKDYVVTLTTVKEDDGPVENEPIEIDVMEESEKYLNRRWSKSSNGLTTEVGRVAFITPINAVNINTVCTVTIKNTIINLKNYKDYFTMYFLNEGKAGTFDPQEGSNPGYHDSIVWSDNYRSCTFSVTVQPGCEYIVLNLPLRVSGTEITESDLSGLIITLIIGGE